MLGGADIQSADAVPAAEKMSAHEHHTSHFDFSLIMAMACLYADDAVGYRYHLFVLYYHIRCHLMDHHRW